MIDEIAGKLKYEETRGNELRDIIELNKIDILEKDQEVKEALKKVDLK